MRARKRLGDMLIEAGLLTAEQLEESLKDKARGSMMLGEYLVSKGILKESQIVEFLSVQLHIQRYEPSQFAIDVTLASIVPPEIALKFDLVPIEKQPHLFLIAMLDPTDIDALDQVEHLTQVEVEPLICTKKELHQLISSIYGKSIGLSGTMESLEDLEYGTGADEESEQEDVQENQLLDLAEGVPVIRMVNWIITQAVREGASDVHLSPERHQVQLRFRIDGKLKEIPPPPKPMFLSIISRIKILSNMDISVSRVPQDGRFTVKVDRKQVNVRTSSLPTVNGENLVLRLLDTSSDIFTLEQLGMCEADRKKVESQISNPYGMILSTGPTGSGKTTTLYSLLQILNKPDINIVTLEDPVEYRMEKIRQVQLNAKAGMTFANGLRSILRQDPDVIMLGEIRDSETATIAVQAALTGHLVLSTAHTNDAAGAVTRLVDMGIEPLLVASVLMVSFAQRLVRRLCPDCSVPYTPPAAILECWGLNGHGEASYLKSTGCHLCNHSGYRGRVGVFEVLLIDDEIKELIVKRVSTRELTKLARDAGKLMTLKDDASKKIQQGLTSLEEASSVVMV